LGFWPSSLQFEAINIRIDRFAQRWAKKPERAQLFRTALQ